MTRKTAREIAMHLTFELAFSNLKADQLLERELTERYDVFVEFEDPSEEEDVPVILRNNWFAEPVEGIVESYSLPGKGELDPSAVTAPPETMTLSASMPQLSA